jgi:site-specific recombinase XerD
MIKEYISYISSVRGYSPLTCLAYQKALTHFATWARENLERPRWRDITRHVIDEYIKDCEQAGHAPSTTNLRLAAIGGIYNYMKRQGKKVENPCQYESRRKVEHTVPNTIPINQLRTAYQNSIGVTRVMLGILITTGIRISELMNLQFHDIDTDANTIKVHGKGAKERVIHVPAEQLVELKAVKEHCPKNGKIFTISERQARKMIYEQLKEYCNAEQLSPHAIRHTFATNLAAQGENVSTIGTILGHNHLETTQKYIDLAAAQKEDAAINNSIIK